MSSETPTQDIEQTKSLDKVGIFLSVLCVIHCMATPFLVFISPWLAKSFDSKWSHFIIFLLIVPVAYFTFYRFYKNHRNKLPMVFGSIGIFLLGVALLSPGHSWNLGEHMHSDHSEHFDYIDTLINIFGSFLLIIGHWMNIKIHRSSRLAQDCCDH